VVWPTMPTLLEKPKTPIWLPDVPITPSWLADEPITPAVGRLGTVGPSVPEMPVTPMSLKRSAQHARLPRRESIHASLIIRHA
jgi:hypothetical protein